MAKSKNENSMRMVFIIILDTCYTLIITIALKNLAIHATAVKKLNSHEKERGTLHDEYREEVILVKIGS